MCGQTDETELNCVVYKHLILEMSEIFLISF